MSEIKESRTSRKRDQKHIEIIDVAAELMAIHGASGVSLEDIAKHADVARKTIYNHFDNKEALILEMIVPVCEHAKGYLKEVSCFGQLSLEHIWTYCLELWEDKSLHAVLLYRVNSEDLKNIDQYKHGFIFVFLQILKLIPEMSVLEEDKLIVISNVIYTTYIPLLQSISHLDDYENLFRKGMTGLVDGLI